MTKDRRELLRSIRVIGRSPVTQEWGGVVHFSAETPPESWAIVRELLAMRPPITFELRPGAIPAPLWRELGERAARALRRSRPTE